MKKTAIILLAASEIDWKQVRKDATKMAKMFLGADMEDDPCKQEKLLKEAETFSLENEKRYSGADEETKAKINQIIDEEADRLSRVFFDSLDDDDEDF